jgi:hypothetical protein
VDGLLKLGSRKQRNRAGTVPVRFAIAGRAVARRRQPVDVVRRAGSSGVTMQAQANSHLLRHGRDCIRFLEGCNVSTCRNTYRRRYDRRS